ncbi:methyltransferase [Roseateles sp. SL47]|uniref:methyltransferase n=1 Tax=Roseateles sp. SL47 TaxID=2995138 RepID=UPI00226ED2C1|nr:methyltransferase [Roseateles sp. SL47]WAC73182.1 methyltransferase [Roseateles sp. SL47]
MSGLIGTEPVGGRMGQDLAATDASVVELVERLIGGYRHTQLLHAAAALGIPDRLAAGAMNAQELAPVVSADVTALYRLLRALSTLGVFKENADGRFAMTPAAQLLRTDAKGSVAGKLLSYGQPWWWGAWQHLTECVRTGRSAFDLQHGTSLFQFLDERPDAAAAFHANMASMTAAMAPVIAEVVELEPGECIADIGGGRGVLMAALLNRHPGTRGILVEQRGVIEDARRYLEDVGLGSRCEVQEGDIFGVIDCQADVFLLKEVIHDWNDEQAVQVLRNCRRSMRPGARLVLAERLVGPGPGSSEAALIDIVMLVMTGGLERTEQQYRALLNAARFELVKAAPTGAGLALLTAIAC